MFAHYLFDEGVLSLREVVRLLLLSGLFTLACLLVFPSNAPSRRIFLLSGIVALAFLPWVLASFDLVWMIPVDTVPTLSLAQVVPNLFLLIWFVVALSALAIHLTKLFAELAGLGQLAQIGHTTPRAVSCHQLASEMAEILAIEKPSLYLGDCACSTTLKRRMLILPADYVRWDEITLQSVIAHEMIHISRQDDKWLLVARTMVLFYWWMPWLLLMYQAYVRVMEESCDDAASELIGEKVGYVDALVSASGVLQLKDSGVLRQNDSGVLNDKTDSASSPTARTMQYNNVAGMHQHHLVGRVGRFALVRQVEANTGGIYWSVLGILLVVTAFTGIQPISTVEYMQQNQQPERRLFSQGVASPLGSVPAVNVRPSYKNAQQMASSDSLFPFVQRSREVIVGSDHSQGGLSLGDYQLADYQAPVVYPGSAIRNKVEGEVLVEFVINADGSVSQVQIIESAPQGTFDRATIRAVKNSRYRSVQAPQHLSQQIDQTTLNNIKRAPADVVGASSLTMDIGQYVSDVPRRLPPIQPLRVRQQFSFRLDEGNTQ